MSTLLNTQCPFCGEGHLTRESRDVEYKYRGHTLLISQPGLYCNCCSESILEPADLKATRIDLQELKARVDGLPGPREVRRLRKLIGWTQEEAGGILGGGHNAFSRYERGELAPPKAIGILLTLLGKHKELKEEIAPEVASK